MLSSKTMQAPTNTHKALSKTYLRKIVVVAVLVDRGEGERGTLVVSEPLYHHPLVRYERDWERFSSRRSRVPNNESCTRIPRQLPFQSLAKRPPNGRIATDSRHQRGRAVPIPEIQSVFWSKRDRTKKRKTKKLKHRSEIFFLFFLDSIFSSYHQQQECLQNHAPDLRPRRIDNRPILRGTKTSPAP